MPPGKKFDVNPALLRELYWEQDVTIEAIGRKFGVHPITVYTKLKKLNMLKHNKGFRSWRRISVPAQKIVFVVAVTRNRGPEMEIALKELLRTVGFPATLRTIDRETPRWRSPS